MKCFRFLFAAALTLQCAAQSQENLPPGATKINYVARIPASVMKYRPKTAITRFYGLAEIQGQKLALHFYDLRRNSRLDLFAVLHRGKTPFYKRMHSVALTRQTSLWAKPRIVCELFNCWLDPTRKTKPIIMARITNYGFGFDGSDNLLTFSDGLQNKPSVNAFEGSSLELSDQTMDYTRSDDNGFLMPFETDFDRGEATYIVYKWNGQQFKEFARQKDRLSDALEYHWDGTKFIENDLSKPSRPTEK